MWQSLELGQTDNCGLFGTKWLIATLKRSFSASIKISDRILPLNHCSIFCEGGFLDHFSAPVLAAVQCSLKVRRRRIKS